MSSFIFVCFFFFMLVTICFVGDQRSLKRLFSFTSFLMTGIKEV